MIGRRMFDDKGNKIPRFSIVTDTGRATQESAEQGTTPPPDYYLVLDGDTVFKLSDKKPMTLEALRSHGYIKFYKQARRMARTTPANHTGQGGQESE